MFQVLSFLYLYKKGSLYTDITLGLCAITNEEQSLVTDYINSLLPNVQGPKYCLNFSSHVLPLLKCSSAYIYVLNFASVSEEDLVWKEIDAKGADRNAISLCLKASLSREIGSEDKDTKKISSSIHALADALPSYGSYKCDVIIGDDVLKDLSVSDEPEFASALYRLLKWHEAHTAIITNSDCSKLKEWCEILNGKIVENKIDSSVGSLIWRGSIQLNVPKPSTNLHCQGMEIRLDLVENEENLSCCESVFTEEDISNQYLVVSPVLQAMDECAFSTIPTYMISPLVFRVCTSEPNLWNETSSKLLEYICRKDEVALIVRMGFSIMKEQPKPNKVMSTSRWKKMVSSGNIKLPENCMPSFKNYFTFVVTKSARSMTAIAYPLMDPNIFSANFYYNLINVKYLKSVKNRNEEKDDDNKVMTLQVPYLSPPLFQLLMRKMKILRKNFNQEGKNENCSSSAESDDYISNILESFEKNLPSSELFKNANSYDVLYNELDPSDWPERVHLLQKQMRMEEVKKEIPLNKFLAFDSRVNQCNVSLSSEDIKKYFQRTGEAKDGVVAEPILSLRDVTEHLKHDFDVICKEKWPAILNCVYDDIYYNCNSQAEEKEAIGNQMVHFYVQHETASTCNNQQLVPDSTINIKPENVTIYRTKPRSPILKKHIPSRKEKIKQNNYENKVLTSNTIRRNLLPTPAAKEKCTNNINFGKEFLERKLSKNSKQNLNMCHLKTNGVPLRSSPRKKNLVKYSSSSSTRATGGNHKNRNKSQELPELSRKKLRVAVVSALENNGINLTDTFFKPCGKRLFAICQAFVQDIPRKKGSTSQRMQEIADAHVKQVIEFEMQKEKGCL